MTEQSLPYNCRERAYCVHHISSYTSQVALIDESIWKLAHVWGSFSHKVLSNFLKLFDNLRKILLAEISDGIPFLSVFLRAYFVLEIQSGYQPLSWSYQSYFWLWRCGFHIFQTVKLCWDIHGDDLVTNLDLLVFPNFLTTTIFHVHRLKQIFLTCELSLPERFLSGATMINRRWCYNW